MKLSDRQEVALIALGDLDDREPGRWHSHVPLMVADQVGLFRRAARTNTLDSLVALGLAEERMGYPALRWERRITDEGRALLASMGD